MAALICFDAFATAGVDQPSMRSFDRPAGAANARI